MFFVMRDFVDVGKQYPRRIGSPTTDWSVAKRLCLKHQGYVMNESREMVGQAFDPAMPRYVGTVVNIGSGEDAACFM
jgi:hypothetical protein